MATVQESAPDSLEREIDSNEVSMPFIPGKVNGIPVKALYSSGSQGCYMTMACVERCQLSNVMDTRSPGHVISVLRGRIPLLGSVEVPIEFEVKLPNGEMKTVRYPYPTLFYVLETDIAEIVLGCIRISGFNFATGTLLMGGGEIPFLPRGEWDEPARSSRYIMATRFLKLDSPKKASKLPAQLN